MEIQIEWLVAISVFLIVFTWAIWFRFTGWLIKRRYKPENDKGRLGEERRKELGGRESTTPGSVIGISGLAQPHTGELLQTTSITSVGEDSNESGKDDTRRRNPFTRKRK